MEANEKYFMENLYAKDINLVIKQTGFFNIYNWQDIDNASIIDLGESAKELNDLIQTASGDVLRNNAAFKGYRYEGTGADEGKTWFHLAFLCTGISAGQGIFNEKTYLNFTSETDDLHKFNMSDLDPKAGGIPVVINTVKKFSIQFFGYANDNPITPYSTYKINAAFIDSLH